MQIVQKKSVSKRNVAAIAAAVLILMSGFLFQLFNFEFLGQTWNIESAVMFNLVQDIWNLDLPGNLETVVIFMVVLYVVILVLYIMNGVGVASDKFSIVASALTFVYLLLGIYFVPTFNNSTSIPFFGSFGTTSLGLGTYILPIIAVAYLLLKKSINDNISF